MLRILLVNDDSLSEGVKLLAQSLSRHGLVYVSVPSKHMSAKSHAICTKTTITFTKLEETIPNTEDCILVDGTPADATRVGLTYFGGVFDVVVSGLNYGNNLAKDMIYSGTVAAAREGAILNVPSIAVSIYRFYSDYIKENLDCLTNYIFDQKLYEKHNLFNINIPMLKNKGIAFASQGQRVQYQLLSPLKDNVFRVDRSLICYNEDPNSDVELLRKNYITVTPLTLDQTDYHILKGLKKNND